MYSKEAPVSATNVVGYLGKPDLISGTVAAGTLIYFFNYTGITNREAMFTTTKDGNLWQIGFNDARAVNLSEFQPYSPQ